MTLIILLSVGGIILWASRRVPHGNEMGFVSAQWLAEYRQNNES
jgi:hypothetical protein